MTRRRRHTPDQIIRKLTEGNKRLAGGSELDEVCRHLEITESTWHRWVAQYGGMKASDAKRLKELEGQNARLKKLLAEAELDKAMLKELAEETFDPEPSPPRRGGAGETVRGLRASSMSGGGPAPLHPAPGPAHCQRGGTAAAGVAAGLLQTATSMGMASSRQAGPPGGLDRQRQAHPAPLAPGRTESALPQAQEAPPGHRHRCGGDVSHHTRRPVGDGLPVRHHRRWPHPQAAQHRRRVHPGVPRHRGGSIHRRRHGRGHPRAPRPGARCSGLRPLRQRARVHRRRRGRLVSLQRCRHRVHRPRFPWQNAWIESFNGRLRDELLNGWQFDSLLEAQVLIEDWRIDYNVHRPHSAHGELTPSEFAQAWTTRYQPAPA